MMSMNIYEQAFWTMVGFFFSDIKFWIECSNIWWKIINNWMTNNWNEFNCSLIFFSFFLQANWWNLTWSIHPTAILCNQKVKMLETKNYTSKLTKLKSIALYLQLRESMGWVNTRNFSSKSSIENLKTKRNEKYLKINKNFEWCLYVIAFCVYSLFSVCLLCWRHWTWEIMMIHAIVRLS